MLQEEPALSSENKDTSAGQVSNLREKPFDLCVVRPSECSHHEQHE